MTTKKTRRRFTPEYKDQAVARLSEVGVTCTSLAAELEVTSGQRKSWHLELLAAASVAALAQSKAEAAELAQLRRDNKRLKEENEVMRKAPAFSLSGRRRHYCKARFHCCPRYQPFYPTALPRHWRQPELVPCLAAHGPGTDGTRCQTCGLD